MRATIFLTAALFFASLLIPLPLIAAEEKGDARKLVEGKCGICHSIKKVQSKQKTKEGWRETVLRMKNDRKAPITNDEAGIIIDYLAKEYGI